MKNVVLALIFTVYAMAQTTPAPKAPAKAPAAKAPVTKAKTAPKAVAKAKAKAKGDLLNPVSLRAKAPAIFVARLETTKGNIDIRVVRAWAPNGVERFYNLVFSARKP